MAQFHYDPMRLSHEPHLLPFRGFTPRVHPSVFLADGSRIIGDVEIGEGASVWYNAVVRGDVYHVRIGAGTNIQDNCVVHVTHDTHPAVIGSEVTVGHGAIVHGCTLEDTCLVGMGATVLDGAVVRSRSFVAAGALVPPRFEVPSGTLVAGVPARVVRELTEEEMLEIASSAANYRAYAKESMEALEGGTGPAPPAGGRRVREQAPPGSPRPRDQEPPPGGRRRREQEPPGSRRRRRRRRHTDRGRRGGRFPGADDNGRFA